MAAKLQNELTFLEKAVATLGFPGVAMDMAVGRIRLKAFQEQSPTPLRGYHGGQQANASPESQYAHRERLEMMWDARYSEKKVPIIAGILDRTCMYAAGQLRYVPNTGDKEIDAIYREWFNDQWSKSADITDRSCLREVVELTLRAILRDGDAGVLMVPHINEFSGQVDDIKLQMITADRIGDPMAGEFDEKKIGGITLDEMGRPIGYDIFKRTRYANYSFEKTVTPQHFLHIFRPQRPDEYRGRSWLAPALPHARDAAELMALEKQAAKFASMFAGFIRVKDPHGNAQSIPWNESRLQDGSRYMDSKAGMVVRIDGSEEVIFAPGTHRPSNAFIQLLDSLVRHIAVSLNLPYGFVWSMEDLGGVNSRLESMQAQRAFARWQRLLVEKFLDKIRDRVFSVAIRAGAIPPHPNFRRGSWRFGAWITADVGHQSQADLSLMGAGLKTRQQWAEENDEDLSQILEENAQAIAIARDISARTNVPIELMIPDLQGASELLAAMDAKDMPQPDPSIIEQHGAAGAKMLIEIFDRVLEGMQDRNSAVREVAELFQIDARKANMIVPVPSQEQLDPGNRLAGIAGANPRVRVVKPRLLRGGDDSHANFGREDAARLQRQQQAQKASLQ